MRLGVLVSGRGSNLEAVLSERPSGIEPVIVISNRPGVRALEVAGRHGVPTVVLRRADFGGDAAHRDAAIGAALSDAAVDLALLAGYDQVLRRSFFEAYRGRAINIHPSLLPAHGGPGMVGAAVHEAVLASGVGETGVTIHEVTQDVDGGPVIAQARVALHAGDDAVTLAGRVLAEEHRLLVSTLRDLAGETAASSSSSEGPSGARGRAC